MLCTCSIWEIRWLASTSILARIQLPSPSAAMHLTTAPTKAGLAAGQASPTVPTQTTLGKASQVPSASATSHAASSASSSAAPGMTTAGPNSPGWLPPNFTPSSSVTWDSAVHRLGL